MTEGCAELKLESQELTTWRALRDREAKLMGERVGILSQMLEITQAEQRSAAALTEWQRDQKAFLDGIGQRLELSETQPIEIDIETGAVTCLR